MLDLLETCGGGDCFYDAVRQCLERQGIHTEVTDLRRQSGIEMHANADRYANHYLLEDVGVPDQQAQTFDQFVFQTIHGREWANELAIDALARSRNMHIEVVSTTNDQSGQPIIRVNDYGVHTDNPNQITVTVAYNLAEAHYRGLCPQVRQQGQLMASR
jgi:OTU-like cysteine protease